MRRKCLEQDIQTNWDACVISVVTDSCRDDEMYETAQQAKERFLGIDDVYKIGDGWNIQNWPIYCEFSVVRA